MNNTIVWVHADNLSPYNPALQVNPDAPAIFVWDEQLLNDLQISLKRIVFIYECLLELPVSIYRGDVVTEVAAFARSHGANRIVTAESPSPLFRQYCRAISQTMPSGSRLEVVKTEPFINYDGKMDLKRFSRYWQVAKKYAFR